MSCNILRFSFTHMTFIFGTSKHSYLKEFFLGFAALSLFPGVKEEQLEYFCIPFPTVPLELSVN